MWLRLIRSITLPSEATLGSKTKHFVELKWQQSISEQYSFAPKKIRLNSFIFFFLSYKMHPLSFGLDQKVLALINVQL